MASPLGNCWQAVVIDDLVNICAVPVDSSPLSASPAGSMHYRALSAYDAADLKGSPDKDIEGATLFGGLLPC